MWLAFYMHMRTGAPDARTGWHGWVCSGTGLFTVVFDPYPRVLRVGTFMQRTNVCLDLFAPFHDSEGSTFISALQYNDRGIAGSTANLPYLLL